MVIAKYKWKCQVSYALHASFLCCSQTTIAAVEAKCVSSSGFSVSETEYVRTIGALIACESFGAGIACAGMLVCFYVIDVATSLCFSAGADTHSATDLQCY